MTSLYVSIVNVFVRFCIFYVIYVLSCGYCELTLSLHEGLATWHGTLKVAFT